MSEQLKYKMTDFEVSPPETVWEFINAQLEEQPLLSIAQKIYAQEVTPPTNAWLYIKNNLTAPVKRRTLSKTSWWLAAASMTGILLLSSYFFLNTSDSTEVAAKASTSITNSDTNKEVLAKSDDKVTNISSGSLISYASNKEPKHSTDKDDIVLCWSDIEEVKPLKNEQPITITPRPILTAGGELIQDMSVVNPHNHKYINITAPNGQQTKISSKLASALHYLGSNSISKDNNWSRRIREWRSCIMQSDFVPTTANFLDILEFTEMVEED